MRSTLSVKMRMDIDSKLLPFHLLLILSHTKKVGIVLHITLAAQVTNVNVVLSNLYSENDA